MAKGKKSQSKTTRTWSPKSQGSVKGNFPAKKDWVTTHSKKDGFKSVELVCCSGNFEPARTGEREVDADNMRQYRANYRADLRTLARQKRVKPATLFDLYKLEGGKAKHPMQLAQQLVEVCKYPSGGSDEIRIV